jgi:hypothetical protein
LLLDLLIIYLFYIPLIFTDVELIIYTVSTVDTQAHTAVLYFNITVSTIDTQAHTAVLYFNITVSTVDTISTHKLCPNVASYVN